jgi:hypothetical protein
MSIFRKEKLTMDPDLLEVVWVLIAADQKEGDLDATEFLRLPQRRGFPIVIPL